MNYALKKITLHPDNRQHLDDCFIFETSGQLNLADIIMISNTVATNECLLFLLNMAGNRRSPHLQEGNQRTLTFCHISSEKQRAS